MTRRPTMLRATPQRRGRRSAAILWFILIALPLVSFGSALAVDVTRLIVSAREASNVTEASAVAGAQQFEPNSWRLNEARARQSAEASIQASLDVKALRSERSRVVVVVRPNSSGSQQVTVTLEYKVKGLVFLPLVSTLLGGSAENSTSFQTLTSTRSADVCVPGRYTPTAGSCVRPVP